MKPIVSDTGKNQSGLFVMFVVVDSKLMLGKHWIHEMWVIKASSDRPSQCFTLKVIVQYPKFCWSKIKIH